MIDRTVSWLAARPLLTALGLVAAMTVPSLARVEALVREADLQPPPMTTEEITTVITSYCRTHACDGVTPEELARAVAAYCAAHGDCRGPGGPAVTPTPGTTTTTRAGLERQEPEIQDPEKQEPEIQDSEIQEAPIPGPTGPTGPAGPAGPPCPAGYQLREVRIPSVSNRTIFLVCVRS